MSIAATAIAEVPGMQSATSAGPGPKVPPSRRTVATADAPLVPEAR